MNAFIDYLNSMHSIKGDGLGALAERQIQSPYSQACHVPRRLGQIIADRIRAGENVAYIITGHAGDGKTSILVQVLRELEMIQAGGALACEKTCQNSNGKLYYVKDMSEVRLEQRVTYLRKALEAPSMGMSSILISNTGPLLSTFEDLLMTDCVRKGEAYDELRRRVNQTKLLDQLDTNQDGTRKIGDYEFAMINIARIDNVSFASAFLHNILNADLWIDCATCEKKVSCPIWQNYETVHTNEGRVMQFINAFLRYTYEFDQRLTIRQIQAQLCYALTGGMSCRDIIPHHNYSQFKYGFPNLFFGYKGSDIDNEAAKIKAIRMLQGMDLDSAALPIDYDFFVKDHVDFFPDGIRDTVFREVLPKLKQLNHSEDADIQKRNKKAIALRKGLRRYYLLYGNLTQEDMLDCVFGKGFTLYENISAHSGLPKAKLNLIRDYIFNALYLINTGFLPHSNSDNQIPLTLHRKDGVFQSVMLVLGRLSKSELTIVQKPKKGQFEDDHSRQQVVLKAKEREFSISLPLFLYFVTQSNGAVASACNPALTHNIARMETLLIDAFQYSSGAEIELMTNTTQGQRYQRLYIENDKLQLD